MNEDQRLQLITGRNKLHDNIRWVLQAVKENDVERVRKCRQAMLIQLNELRGLLPTETVRGRVLCARSARLFSPCALTSRRVCEPACVSIVWCLSDSLALCFSLLVSRPTTP
jgi:hypothetical protein